MTNLTLVLAGSKKEYEDYLKTYNLSSREHRYVREVKDARGVIAKDVIVLSGFHLLDISGSEKTKLITEAMMSVR